MKALSVAVAFVFAARAVAAPSQRLMAKLDEMHQERRAKREAGISMSRSGPPLAENYTTLDDRVSFGDLCDVAEARYDANWAGAIMLTSGITEVKGEFTVPSIKVPPGGSNNKVYGASAWVGIDGDTCSSAILQTGVEMAVGGSEHEYFGWYEWYPNFSHKFANFKVRPGDKIRATVKATSDVSGVAMLENISTGKTVKKTFKNMGSVGRLCRRNAEWIVEDFQEGKTLIPFADFGKVTFTGAGYNTGSKSHGVGGAGVVDVRQNGKVKTRCGKSGSSAISCTYV